MAKMCYTLYITINFLFKANVTILHLPNIIDHVAVTLLSI